jgi:hypothetical protein
VIKLCLPPLSDRPSAIGRGGQCARAQRRELALLLRQNVR